MSSTVSFDATDDAVVQCPYEHYRNMRDEAPVLELDGASLGRLNERVFAVSRHEDVKRILHDTTTFSSRFGGASAKPSPELMARLKEVMVDGWPSVSTLLTEDPPSHTRYRRLVSMAFTPRRVSRLEPALRQICETLVDDFGEESRVDFIAKFAVPLPIAAVATILEIPDRRREDFKRWADSSVAAIGRAITDDERVAAERDILEQQHYFVSELDARRDDPRDDFLTDLLNAELTADDEVEGGPLDTPEMLSIIRQIQVAGSETTASLLADLMVQLAEHPDEWERLKADPSRAPKVVEEALRWASPNQGLFRIVQEDTEVAGTPIPKGSTVWIMYGSADHDDRVFDDPEAFNPDRERLNSHIAFGHGIHFCLGAALARLEAVTALKVMAARLDTISVVEPESLRYGSSFILRGLEHLELDVTYQ
ncbi:cytochrome P450 [Ilumatobacter nonamiensis]|uniref:cytochrome P450 n=1 Tax=Ilumatobacter nonamiensis TaxID=467093 RepID=UPI00034B7DA3|nr:cytochrome P450 [Ilumatobacter nonamiensis]